MNTLLKKFSLFHYNIGIFDYDPASLLQGKINIHWMKHPYKDRFFADPFILDVTDNEIKILVEEFPYKEWKGKISLLTIGRSDYKLKSKKILLELDTHLSFPFIYRTKTDIFVIPENSASGQLNAYRYVAKNESLRFEGALLEQPVIDPIIIHQDNHYLLFGTLHDKQENKNLYSWQSEEPLRGYIPTSNIPIKSDNSCGRRGGDFFSLNNELYSATQSCINNYGEALNICKVTDLSNMTLKEEVISTIYPNIPYANGLHTFNHYKDVGVVDGLTFLFNPIQKLTITIKRKIILLRKHLPIL